MADAGSIANNGVNVAALIAAREALTKAPAAAQFKWRAACEWKNGTHSHSTVEGFYGLGQEQHHKKTFTFDADHPEIFASEDQGAAPIEYVLVGLASCLTGAIAAVAQYRNIQRFTSACVFAVERTDSRSKANRAPSRRSQRNGLE